MFDDFEYLEQLEGWFEKYEKEDPKFEDLEHKYNECMQVSALVFLTTKLKDKKERYFLHGEHDIIYIGADWDTFEKFTEEDVKIAVAHGIIMDNESEGFTMYASM